MTKVVLSGENAINFSRSAFPNVTTLSILGGEATFPGYTLGDDSKLEQVTIDVDKYGSESGSFRYAKNLKTFRLKAKNATLDDRAFVECPSLVAVDLTECRSITYSDSTFSAMTTTGQNNTPMSHTATIYVNSTSADPKKAENKAGLSDSHGIVAITNGGTFPESTTFEGGTLATPTKEGYTFGGWYTKDGANGDWGNEVTDPTAGQTYYAKWTKNDSVVLTSNPDADGDGKVSATYNPDRAVTLSVQNPGAGWLYTWMKNGEQIPAAGNSLTLYTPSDSGNYSVKVVAGGSGTEVWTSNTINVTITKAAGTASVSMDGWAYGETAKTPVPASATNGTENVTYQYKVKDADDSTYSAAVPTAAGSYTVKATFPATENYEETAATTDFTIAQAAPTVSITAEPASLVGGGTVKLTVTTNAPAKVVPTCDGVTVTENSDGTFSAVLPNETKTYTFTASYDGDANHKEASDTCQVSVTRRSSSGGSSSSDRSYAVTAPSTKNGDVTVSPKNASKGDRVTVTVTPDKGYELDKLTVKDASGNKLKLTDKGNGKYTFTMPGSKVTVSAEFVEEQAASIFADVPADAYYAKAVEWAVKKGITNGKANGLFGSNDPCTRGQIVTFLWRAAGSPAPKGTAKVPGDVLPGSYCYDAVAWALENGITNGLADGTFGVNNTCTRGQSVTFLYRAMGTAPTTVNGFTDVESNAFCAEAVAWAVENGVTNGTSATTFSPSNGCTRAQIVTFLFRAYNK